MSFLEGSAFLHSLKEQSERKLLLVNKHHVLVDLFLQRTFIKHWDVAGNSLSYVPGIQRLISTYMYKHLEGSLEGCLPKVPACFFSLCAVNFTCSQSWVTVTAGSFGHRVCAGILSHLPSKSQDKHTEQKKTREGTLSFTVRRISKYDKKARKLKEKWNFFFFVILNMPLFILSICFLYKSLFKVIGNKVSLKTQIQYEKNLARF